LGPNLPVVATQPIPVYPTRLLGRLVSAPKSSVSVTHGGPMSPESVERIMIPSEDLHLQFDYRSQTQHGIADESSSHFDETSPGLDEEPSDRSVSGLTTSPSTRLDRDLGFDRTSSAPSRCSLPLSAACLRGDAHALASCTSAAGSTSAIGSSSQLSMASSTRAAAPVANISDDREAPLGESAGDTDAVEFSFGERAIGSIRAGTDQLATAAKRRWAHVRALAIRERAPRTRLELVIEEASQRRSEIALVSSQPPCERLSRISSSEGGQPMFMRRTSGHF